MLRIASKTVVVAALLGGLGVAAAGAFHAETGDLPAVPGTASVASAPANPESAVVDLKDWQQTRIIVGKTSNTVPTKK